MKLSIARLCLDCDEVHEEPQCPSCGSESFAFLSRWIDPGSQRPAARVAAAAAPVDRERLEAVRALTASGPPRRGAGRRAAGIAAGLATLGVAGWVWAAARKAARPADATPPAEGR